MPLTSTSPTHPPTHAQYRRGGKTTQSVWEWGAQHFLLGGGEAAAGKDVGGLLMIGGGEGGGSAAVGGAPGLDDRGTVFVVGWCMYVEAKQLTHSSIHLPIHTTALIALEEGKGPRRKKRKVFVDAGKAALQVIQLPFKIVSKGLHALFTLGRGGKLKSKHTPKRAPGVLDMTKLTPEELEWIEEVYQGT